MFSLKVFLIFWKFQELHISPKQTTIKIQTSLVLPSLTISYITSIDWAVGRSIPAILRKRAIPFSQEKKFQPVIPTYIPQKNSAFLQVPQKNEVFQFSLFVCNFPFNCFLFQRENKRWYIKVKQKIFVSQKNVT